MLRDIVRSRTSAVSLVQRTKVILGAFDRIDNQDIAEERRVHFVGGIGKNRYSLHFDKVKHGKLTILRNMQGNRSVPPSGVNYARKGLRIVKHIAIPGHLRMLVIHEGACCEPCGLLS